MSRCWGRVQRSQRSVYACRGGPRRVDNVAPVDAGQTYPASDAPENVVAEEAQYEIDDLVDRAIVVQIDGRLGFVLHRRLCSSREQASVGYDADEISVHVTPCERGQEGTCALDGEDDNVGKVLESLRSRRRCSYGLCKLYISNIDSGGSYQQHVAFDDLRRFTRIMAQCVNLALAADEKVE